VLNWRGMERGCQKRFGFVKGKGKYWADIFARAAVLVNQARGFAASSPLPSPPKEERENICGVWCTQGGTRASLALG
jgi:hypothetical protein